MEQFRYLTIRPHRADVENTMKALKGCRSAHFKTLNKESDTLAWEQGVEGWKYASFEVQVKHLDKARVWLMAKGDCIELINVVPGAQNNSLTREQCNDAVELFARDVAYKCCDEDEVELGTDKLEMSDLIGSKPCRALTKWLESCNQSAPISHPVDAGLWFDFIESLLVESKDEKSQGALRLTGDLLEQWLLEDCGWQHKGLERQAYEMGKCFDYSMELLSHLRKEGKV